MTAPTFAGVGRAIDKVRRYEVLGKVAEVVGLVIESVGPSARIGDVCQVVAEEGSDPISCEVVGFRSGRVLMMPLGDLQGVKVGSLVRATGTCLGVPVGPGLLGRTIDALGRPIDGFGPLGVHGTYPSIAAPPNAMQRKLIADPFETGVRAIDSCMTTGVGQRVGIFAGSGVGKSTLLGMIARNGNADVNVIALVGERGREVR